MRRAVLLGVTLMALTLARTAQGYDPNSSYTYRILDNPTTGDAFGLRNAIQQNAQGRADGMFGALANLLGGTAPQINFVSTGSQFTPNHMSANVTDQLGAPRGTINMDPLTVNALVSDNNPDHNVTVNQVPHEMAHTRQTPQTLADLLSREGGAQAFADLETAPAAAAAHIPYTPGNYDGAYADYVKQIQATRSPSWITAGQFGR